MTGPLYKANQKEHADIKKSYDGVEQSPRPAVILPSNHQPLISNHGRDTTNIALYIADANLHI